MRVGIGAALNPTGGPARYAEELVRALATSGGGDDLVVFTNRPEVFPPPSAGVHVVRVGLATAAVEPLWDHLFMPLAARRWALDVYHGVKGAIPLAIGCRRVVTIHDLAIYACPETFAWPQHVHMRAHLRHCARAAAHIVADSEHARADIIARLRVPPQRVTAVLLGVRAELFAPVEGAGAGDHGASDLPPHYFLYAGTLQPRKNIDLVVRAFESLDLGGDWHLLIAGRRRPDYQPAWLNTPPPGVRYLGAVSDAALARLYRQATALVSPSSYEGFGLTLLEAMASGCPVICAPVTSVPEVVGDTAMLLPVIDLDAVRTAMKQVMADTDLRADLARRGRERAQQFSWARTAERMRTVYREVARGE